MLFIQYIELTWHKDVRYPNYAQQRRALRFAKVEKPRESLEGCEICYFRHEYGQSTEGITEWSSTKKRYQLFGEEGFYNGRGDEGRYAHKIAVLPDDGGYSILYCLHKGKSYYTPKFTLKEGEYGRIIFSERRVYFDDGGWYYVQGIYNLINGRADKFSPKMFYQKDTDYLFEDMKYLK